MNAAPVAIRGQVAGRPDSSVPATGGGEDAEADRAAYPLRLSARVGEGSILIKAPGGIRPAALRTTRDMIGKILAEAEPAIVERLGTSRLEVILAPNMSRFTDLPDLRDLARTRNAFGQPLDLARGIFRGAEPPRSKSRRPTRHSPLIAVGEEDILRIVPCGPHSAFHHEFAHALYNLALSPEQRAGWRDAFEGARRLGLFKDRYAALNEDEFFAELSQAYFDVAPHFCSRSQLARIDPAAFARLAEVYSSRPRDQPPKSWSASDSTPGLRLAYEEVGRDSAMGNPRVSYKLKAAGFAKGKTYTLWARRLDDRISRLGDGLSLSESGYVVRRMGSEEVEVIVSLEGVRPGEPCNHALVSSDGSIRAIAKVIPFPIEAKGDGTGDPRPD
jgi:hypothetical protein